MVRRLVRYDDTRYNLLRFLMMRCLRAIRDEVHHHCIRRALGATAQSRTSRADFYTDSCALSKMMQSWQIPRLTLCAMMVLFAASAYGLNMCTEDKVNSCMKMMSRLDNGTDLITKLTEECRNVRKFEICIEPMKSTCKPELKLLIEMTEGSYKFSCQKRNFYEFRKYADCVDEVMPEIVNRTSEFTYDMERDARRNTLICKFMKRLSTRRREYRAPDLWVRSSTLHALVLVHASSWGFSLLPTGQTPKSRKMSSESAIKLDPSVKLGPPMTPSPGDS
ncbi:hypothetical protein LSAT2_006239 [Lamellibrachia satsuma]|nr:hypothetical protein LSAT2_006239 [Lamellibrachia satsuma]